jgi:hypothetical protein
MLQPGDILRRKLLSEFVKSYMLETPACFLLWDPTVILLNWLRDGDLLFLLDYVYLLYYVYCFAYVVPSLHPCNETYLITRYDHFNVLLDSVSKYFVEEFYICASVCIRDIGV